MERKTHYFYALKLPIEEKLLLQERCNKLQQHFPFKRWVHPEDYHITLAFLGDAPQRQLESSIELVEKRLREMAIFSLRINHLGIFGRKDTPRIFWAGVEDIEQLSRLREVVFSACLDAGFTLEGRPFHPHITLARNWAGDTSFTSNLLHKHDSLKERPIVFDAGEVVLYETHVERTPKYEEINIFSL